MIYQDDLTVILQILQILSYIAVGFRYAINYIMFFVNDNFLKSVCFSLLMLNLIQFLGINSKKWKKLTVQFVYLSFIFLEIIGPFIANIPALEWYQWILLFPIIFVISFGFFVKYMHPKYRFWFDYSHIHLYYTIILVVYCLLLPESGNFIVVMLYSAILYIIANLKNSKRGDND